MIKGATYRISLAKSETSNCTYEGIFVEENPDGFLEFSDCFWVNEDVPEKRLRKFNKRYIVKIALIEN